MFQYISNAGKQRKGSYEEIENASDFVRLKLSGKSSGVLTNEVTGPFFDRERSASPAPGRRGVKELGWIAVYSYPGSPAPGRRGELHN
jgi:hypothetical protein